MRRSIAKPGPLSGSIATDGYNICVTFLPRGPNWEPFTQVAINLTRSQPHLGLAAPRRVGRKSETDTACYVGTKARANLGACTAEAQPWDHRIFVPHHAPRLSTVVF